jgi:NAD(P)-dependent dehydrogenase (short-subunit alcohol dehydrogenase family)
MNSTNLMRLSGRKAIVTGSGSFGIGRAIALRFAREGADVVVHGLGRPEVTEELAEEVRSMGRRSQAFDVDFSQAARVRSFMQKATAFLGGLDILVANAATITRKPFLEITDDEFSHVQAVNLHGYFACSQEAARTMVKAGYGRIIMVSSINQQKAIRNQSHYCASKGGIMQMAKTMAIELAQTGVTVNIIAPAAALTDFNRHIMADAAVRKRFESEIPAGRLAVPEDFTGAAAYLASEESAFMTGASMFIDGGRSLA